MRLFSEVRAGSASRSTGTFTNLPSARRWFSSLPLRLVAIFLLLGSFTSVSQSGFFAPLAALSSTPSVSASTLAEGPDAATDEEAPPQEDAAPSADSPQPDSADQAGDSTPVDPRAGTQTAVSSRGGARPAPSSIGDRVAEIAKQYEGAPYRWAGASPAGFDCSGFSMYVYGKAGISIPRTLGGQLQSGRQVGIDDLKPGDIVFFANTFGPGLSHSGIYLGDNQFINAESEWAGVVTRSLRGTQWEGDFVGGSRPYENN